MVRVKEELTEQLAAAKAAGRHLFDARFDLWRLRATGRRWRDGAAKAAARHFFDAPFDLWRLAATGASWRDGAPESPGSGPAGGGESGGLPPLLWPVWSWAVVLVPP